nr:putative reverse transcriptase domain-containing protein [Tanacetum cinerariifolium]
MWEEVGEGQLIGLELVQETTEKISQIKDKLKAAHDRQKIYADKRRKPLDFSVGEHVLLKVSPWKGVIRLPEELNGVHDTFHVSNLRKCLADPTLQIPLDEIRVDAKLNFVEEPVEILEREFKKLKRSRIAIIKVRIKGGKEREIKKGMRNRNSCSLCGGSDYNKRTCTGMFKDQDEVVVAQDEVVQEKVDLVENEKELI